MECLKGVRQLRQILLKVAGGDGELTSVLVELCKELHELRIGESEEGF